MAGTRQRPQRPGTADSERGISPTSARVMLETRLIEGMLLGRSADVVDPTNNAALGYEQRCNSNSYPAKFNHREGITRK